MSEQKEVFGGAAGHECALLCYTGEEVDLIDCYRAVAIMVADGKMYLSDCDHQECLYLYCRDKKIDCGLKMDEHGWNDIHEAAVTTEELFADENEDVYGFDVFEGFDDICYLTSHFPENMEKCYELMSAYAEEHGYVLGTFYDSSYRIKIIEN